MEILGQSTTASGGASTGVTKSYPLGSSSPMPSQWLVFHSDLLLQYHMDAVSVSLHRPFYQSPFLCCSDNSYGSRWHALKNKHSTVHFFCKRNSTSVHFVDSPRHILVLQSFSPLHIPNYFFLWRHQFKQNCLLCCTDHWPDGYFGPLVCVFYLWWNIQSLS